MIGEKIKQFRCGQNISLTELAAQVGVSRSYLDAIECNLASIPSIQFTEKVAKILEISVMDLLISKRNENINQLDEDWLQLVQEAMHSSVTKEEFNAFLESKREKMNQKE